MHLRQAVVTMLAGLILCLTLPVCLGSAHASEPIDVWVPIDFTGDNISAIVVDPQTTSTLYAASGDGRIYKSTDSGLHWQLVRSGSGQLDTTILVIDPQAPTTLYAGFMHPPTAERVIKSTDGGDSWVSATGDLPGGGVLSGLLSLAIDPVTPNTLYAAISNHGIYKTTDGGKRWNLVYQAAPSALAVNATAPSVVYAALYEGTGSHVVKSMNGGIDWRPADSGLPSYVNNCSNLVVDPSTPDTLYVACLQGGVFKSTDGGNNWQPFNTGPASGFSLFVDPTSSATLYETGNGLYKSTDGGSKWQRVDRGIPVDDLRALAIDASAPNTLYAGTSAGVFKSVDGGGIWNPANAGMQQGSARAGIVSVLAVDPAAPATVYASAGTGGLYTSTDGGDSWRADASDLPRAPVNVMAFDPFMRAIRYAGINDGVYRSEDGGGTWQPASTGLPALSAVVNLVIDPVTPTTLYAVLFDGVYKTTDGGNSWNSAQYGLPNSILALVIDPVTPTTLYAGTNLGVYKSVDGGDSWSVPLPGLNLEFSDLTVRALIVDHVTPTTLYAGLGTEQGVEWPTHGSVLKSTDGGNHWIRMDSGLPIQAVNLLAIDPVTPTTLYVGMMTGWAEGSLYKSPDGGAHWLPFGANNAAVSIVFHLAIAPSLPSVIYASGTGGLYALRRLPEHISLPSIQRGQ
jgi:photosystem II stability/assembly factor-like uncharacterized protein